MALRVILAESDDLSHVADLTTVATGKQFQIALNRSGSFSFSVPITHNLATELNVLNRCIKLYKNETCVWSGPIWNKSQQVPENRVSINSVGWFEILNKRLLTGSTLSYGGGTNRGTIAFGLLSRANADQDTWITQGTNNHTLTFPDPVTYDIYTNIGAEILNLSNIESGFDWTIDPETRVMDLFDSDSPTFQEDVVFSYNKLTNNVQQLSITEDADEMVNDLYVLGKYLTAQAEDTDAQTNYQLFQKTESLTEIGDEIILAAFANAEVAISANPRLLYSFTPFPLSSQGVTHSIFEDYNIGDIVYLVADYGSITIEKQAMRVFGTTITIDDEGNEKLSSIQSVNT